MDYRTNYFNKWGGNNNKLRKFVSKNDRYPVLSGSVAEIKLAEWVHMTREFYRKGELSARQIDFMDNIPGWNWECITEWDSYYNDYFVFVESTGFHPELSTFDNSECSLKKWAIKNKKDFKNNDLTMHQKKMLKKIPGWKWTTGSGWNDKYEMLERFITRYGRYPEFVQISPRNFENNLKIWVDRQKIYEQKGDLLEVQKEKLNQLANWNWKTTSLASSLSLSMNSSTLKKLTKYSLNYGDLSMTLDRTDFSDTFNLSNIINDELNQWYVKAVYQYRNGLLSPNEISRLRIWVADIDFEESWKDNVIMFREFVDLHGRSPYLTCPLDSFYFEKNERYLVDWINQTIRFHSMNLLSPDKREFYYKFLQSGNM